MLQPFERFRPAFIPGLLELNKPFLVTQQYYRVQARPVDDCKINLLVSDYDDPGLAKIHHKAVMADRYAAIIDLNKPAHLKKINEMLSSESAYEIYWAVVRSKKALEQQINTRFKDRMRQYIAEHTNWRIDRDASLRPGIQLIFGELFIVLKHGKQVVRFKFEELEKA